MEVIVKTEFNTFLYSKYSCACCKYKQKKLLLNTAFILHKDIFLFENVHFKHTNNTQTYIRLVGLGRFLVFLVHCTSFNWFNFI